MDRILSAILWPMTLAVYGAVVMGYKLPLLNDNDVKVINLTDSSVALVWLPIEDMSDTNLDEYRLMVSYQRQGYNPVYINTFSFDPDCSLRLSHCQLSGLAPETLYSVTVTIDQTQNNTLLGRADLNFFTLPKPEPEKDILWWLMYVAAPCTAALILIIIIIIIIARCRRCCCWRKKKSTHMSVKSTSSSSRQDTFRAIQPDPPSTYDHPMYSPTLSPSQREQNHAYLHMHELPVPKTAPPPLPRPSTNSDQTSPVSPGPTPYINSAINVYGDRGQTKTDRPNQRSGIPVLPYRDCPPLQAPPPNRQGRQQQVIYTNTEDVNKLLGSAKKMFPML